MLFLNTSKIIVLLATAIDIVYGTRDYTGAELSYQKNILSQNRIAEHLSCPQNIEEMYSTCYELFLRPHYRHELRIFINNTGFFTGTSKCLHQTITFVSKPDIGLFPTDRQEFMFPCWGRHEPIRTSPTDDDYRLKFLLATIPNEGIFYVFVATKVADKGYKIYLHEVILDMPSPIPNRQIDLDDLERELVLVTIPTVNRWPSSLEYIYVHEVIVPGTPIQDQLQGLDLVRLYLLCSFLLGGASYESQAFLIDPERMKQSNGSPGPINVYFDYEDGDRYNGFLQIAYPCYGKSISGRTTDNQKHINLYRISSGPRIDSFIVYTHLFNQLDYKIKHFHENVKLKEIWAPREDSQSTEAGPSEPARKRARIDETLFQTRTSMLPRNEPAHPTTTGKQQVTPTDPSQDQQLANQTEALPYPTLIQQRAIQAGVLPQQPPPRSQQLTLQEVGSSSYFPNQSQQLTPPQVGSSRDIPSQGQLLPIQARNFPYQPLPTGQQPTPPQVESSNFYTEDYLLDLLGFADQPPPDHQITPSEVGPSYDVSSQDQPFAIQAEGLPDQSADQLLDYLPGGYSSSFLNLLGPGQEQPSVDYGFHYQQPLVDEGQQQPTVDYGFYYQQPSVDEGQEQPTVDYGVYYQQPSVDEGFLGDIVKPQDTDYPDPPANP